MGQVRTVQVHRLLAKDTVDEHMRRVLAQKSELFDESVRKSQAKRPTKRLGFMVPVWSLDHLNSLPC